MRTSQAQPLLDADAAAEQSASTQVQGFKAQLRRAQTTRLGARSTSAAALMGCQTDAIAPKCKRALSRRQSSVVQLNDTFTSSRIGRVGAWRAEEKDMWESDLLGVRTDACGPFLEMSPQDAAQRRFDMMVAFVARRVYRRLRNGLRTSSKPALLKRFCEENFRQTPRRRRLLCPRLRGCFGRADVQESQATSVTTTDVFNFIHSFATWCALPTDLVVVSLVYVDRIVDECVEAGSGSTEGVLSSDSWRPILVSCMMLASKFWEDICVTNLEAAACTDFSTSGILSLEFLTMDALKWNAHISAELFAPYFWAAEKVLSEGKDDLAGNLNEPATADRRKHLERTLTGSQAPYPSSKKSLKLDGGDFASDADVKELLAARRELPGNIVFEHFEDRYSILKMVGTGGFGVIYFVARKSAPSQICAVKVTRRIPPAAVKHRREMLRTFIFSGIAGSLRHKNVIRFFEFVADATCSFSCSSILPVMEALHGPDLFEWLQLRQKGMESNSLSHAWMSESEVASISRQIASGLNYLHSLQHYLVHRDVKPENLKWSVLSDDLSSDLKIVDFGLVYVGGAVNEVQGNCIGTKVYCAPEALNGYADEAPAPSADIYSFGVVMFLLLVCRFPWGEDDVHRTDDITAELEQGVTPNAQMLVQQLLSTDPLKRPTALDFLNSPWLADAEKGELSEPVLHVPPHCLESLRLTSRLSKVKQVSEL